MGISETADFMGFSNTTIYRFCKMMHKMMKTTTKNKNSQCVAVLQVRKFLEDDVQAGLS